MIKASHTYCSRIYLPSSWIAFLTGSRCHFYFIGLCWLPVQVWFYWKVLLQTWNILAAWKMLQLTGKCELKAVDVIGRWGKVFTVQFPPWLRLSRPNHFVHWSYLFPLFFWLNIFCTVFPVQLYSMQFRGLAALANPALKAGILNALWVLNCNDWVFQENRNIL